MFSSPGDLPNPGIELGSPELHVGSLLAELPGKPSTQAIVPGKRLRRGLPWGVGGKESICQCRTRRWGEKIPEAQEQLSLACHDYWACAPEPGSPCPRAGAGTGEATAVRSLCTDWRKSLLSNEDPEQPKKKRLRRRKQG